MEVNWSYSIHINDLLWFGLSPHGICFLKLLFRLINHHHPFGQHKISPIPWWNEHAFWTLFEQITLFFLQKRFPLRNLDCSSSYKGVICKILLFAIITKLFRDLNGLSSIKLLFFTLYTWYDCLRLLKLQWARVFLYSLKYLGLVFNIRPLTFLRIWRWTLIILKLLGDLIILFFFCDLLDRNVRRFVIRLWVVRIKSLIWLWVLLWFYI